MKTLSAISLFVMIMLTAVMSWAAGAEEASTVTAKKQDYLYSTNSPSGLRVGVLTSLLNLQATGSDSIDLDSAMGVQIGYADLSVGELGFLGTLNYLMIDDEQLKNTSAVRVDMNLAFAFNERIYGFAGMNLHDFIGSDDATIRDMNLGLGGQAGIGFQINDTLGLMANYVITRNSKSISGVDQNVDISGIELSLNATF